jgi:adenylate cyclase
MAKTPAGEPTEEPTEEISEEPTEVSVKSDRPKGPDVLRREIADYYVSDQIVEAFSRHGEIPQDSHDEILGIGFIDIVNYSRFTQQLSSREHQSILNGLYTAFHLVLRMHGGFLNKIEGDSIMFQFGGMTDPHVSGMTDEEKLRDVSVRLFRACVQMQRFARFFNEANEHFFTEALQDSQERPTEADLEALNRAFRVVESLRNALPNLNRSVDALSQIEVRIGATISIGSDTGGLNNAFVRDLVKSLLTEEYGDVAEERRAIYFYIRDHSASGGNFGPVGAKQWDILGPAVIEAKRLETTAPIGGLRISELLYRVLEITREARYYWRRFQQEAKAFSSLYRFAEMSDLFKRSTVVLEDKGNVTFETYNVQVNPRLPERVSDQIQRFLGEGLQGANNIIRLLQYYRGISHVVTTAEETLSNHGVVLRKRYMIETMFPNQSKALAEQFDGDEERIETHINAAYSLYDILEKLDRFRDIIKVRRSAPSHRGRSRITRPETPFRFVSHDDHMNTVMRQIQQSYEDDRSRMVQRAYFFNVVDPLVFESIRASILERQISGIEIGDDIAELEELLEA